VKPQAIHGILTAIGESNQSVNLKNHLRGLGAKTYIVEKNYTDKNYLIDYATFHCRNFDPPSTLTKRVHCFDMHVPENYIERSINDIRFRKSLCQAYLGSIIVKPILSEEGYPLIGKTILKPPNHVEKGRDSFITVENKTNLYGIDYTTTTLPFQTQDIAVGACATTCLWIAQYPLNSQFDIPLRTPAEITMAASSFPTEYRIFPSGGLTIEQMFQYIHNIDLEKDVISVKKIPLEIREQFIPLLIKIYINAGLPIIASLELKKGCNPSYHAVVISGYHESNDGLITKIYVHDDQIAPYCTTISDDNFVTWHNNWIDKYHYDSISVERLIMPIYNKLRLPYSSIYKLFSQFQSELTESNFSCCLFLIQVNRYKASLLKMGVKNITEVLSAPLPRFLWIMRVKLDSTFVYDAVYDGTSAIPKQLRIIEGI